MISQIEQWEHLMGLAAQVRGDADVWNELWRGLEPQVSGWLRQPRFLGRVSEREDLRHDILMLVWEKLQDHDYNKMRVFFDKTADGTELSARRFRGWVRRVCKNIAIDHMRGLPEFIRQRKPRPKHPPADGAPAAAAADTINTPAHWRSPVTLHSGVAAVRDPVTVEILARQMFDYLDDSIPERQRDAAALRDAGANDEQIAAKLGVEPEHVGWIVARAQSRLQYRSAVELWTQGMDTGEIAQQLGLESSAHAYRLLNAAKQLLRRKFTL